MVPALQQPPARITFVVGKGGVGKSTAAAALALAWSGRAPVHLLSTDPAHSLGDVLGLPLPLGVATSACTPGLIVEQLDADAKAREWQEEARAPLAELLGAGSLLRDQDIAAITSLRLPGTGEIAAALRLVELSAAGGTIVVDTAPTAHTLRLLDAHLVLGTWADMLAALAARADAVTRALTGATLVRASDRFRSSLADDIARFRDHVVAGAAFLVATRPGELEDAETAWLLQELDRRGLRVAAVLRLCAPAGSPGITEPATVRVVAVPWLVPSPRGCSALEHWLRQLGAEPPVAPVAVPSRRDAAAVPAERWLAARKERLLLFAGKGGVGKSTCAAAAAATLSESRPVLLLGADPAGSLTDLLQVEVGARPVQVAPGLRAAQIDPAGALTEWRATLRPQLEPLLGQIGLAGSSREDRAVLQSIWEATPPGLDELVALSDLLELATVAETVVVDTAPTGHFLRLLELPELALEWTHALMRLLLEYGLASELDALTKRVLAFARQLKILRSRLADAGWTGTVIVTIAEPVVEAETERLAYRLGQAGVPITAVLSNCHTQRSVGLALAVPRLIAPVRVPSPRGLQALRRFTSSWDLL